MYQSVIAIKNCLLYNRFSCRSQPVKLFQTSLKKCWMSNAANVLSAQGKKKGFLIYHNLKFKIWLPRCFCVVGIFVCGMAINVTGGLTDLAQKSEPEVSEKPFSFPKTFYDKSYSKYIPLVYATTGIVIFYLSRKFVNGNVKKMLLDADRKNVTLVTYNLFKKELVQTFPVKDMKFSGSSLKVKNYSSSYYFMSSGTITNETLFRYAVNSKQLLHKN